MLPAASNGPRQPVAATVPTRCDRRRAIARAGRGAGRRPDPAGRVDERRGAEDVHHEVRGDRRPLAQQLEPPEDLQQRRSHSPRRNWRTAPSSGSGVVPMLPRGERPARAPRAGSASGYSPIITLVPGSHRVDVAGSHGSSMSSPISSRRSDTSGPGHGRRVPGIDDGADGAVERGRLEIGIGRAGARSRRPGSRSPSALSFLRCERSRRPERRTARTLGASSSGSTPRFLCVEVREPECRATVAPRPPGDVLHRAGPSQSGSRTARAHGQRSLCRSSASCRAAGRRPPGTIATRGRLGNRSEPPCPSSSSASIRSSGSRRVLSARSVHRPRPSRGRTCRRASAAAIEQTPERLSPQASSVSGIAASSRRSVVGLGVVVREQLENSRAVRPPSPRSSARPPRARRPAPVGAGSRRRPRASGCA